MTNRLFAPDKTRPELSGANAGARYVYSSQGKIAVDKIGEFFPQSWDPSQADRIRHNSARHEIEAKFNTKKSRASPGRFAADD